MPQDVKLACSSHSSLVVAYLAANADGGARVTSALRKEPAFGEAIVLLKTNVETRPILARIAFD